MIKNYLKTAFRNLLRYKGFALINIASLTIGMIGCFVIGLFVWDEWEYDKNIPGGSTIYRIYDQRNNNGNVTFQATTPPAFATFLKQQYPEVDTTLRILMADDKFLMESGDKKSYEDKGWFVESSFFKIFPLKLTRGDAGKALAAPSTIVISEEIAKKYFGKEDPVGKTMRVDKIDYNVTAVMAKLPEHFHLNFRYLMSLSTLDMPQERMERWTWNQFYTYVKLKPGADINQVQNKFQAHVKKVIYPTLTQANTSFLPFFQALKNIHLQSSDFVYDNAKRGNETYVKALTIIAIFVLAIACFNFINLATARSLRRAKEIGVRKVVGAERKQLVFQFIGETILLSVFSMIIAVIATLVIIPLLNRFTDKSISFDLLTNPLLALIILLSGIAVGIIAGIYPALVLSGFQPIKVLKSAKVTAGTSGTWLRQALVVMQFSLSVLLIVSTTIVYRQTKYLNDKDLGFNREQVVYFQVRDSLSSNPKTLETFKSELKQSANVISVTSGYGLPGDRFAGDGVSIGPEQKEHPANVFIADEDYVKTLGLRIIAGRDFSREMSTDAREAFLINETAVKEFGYGTPEKAIGQPMSWNEWYPTDSLHPVKRGKVIGVVQDFHYKSLHEKVTASVIQLYPQVAYTVAAKLKTADIKGTLSFINNVWNKYVSSYPLDYKFMDESYGAMYKSEEKLSELLWIFTIMAIIVGCMGLFGLAAFSAEQRTKEIGIRKVLGANILDIVGLLSRSFLVLVAIASLIAFPIAWWAMNNWLKNFPYRIMISWWVFAIAIIAALAIALLTVSFQSIKAAIANPVKSLRTE
ncbi:MAG TPA: ABC transporter permease [Chitinophagaceae bacterium]|jgi:putative ABC transport system permease protein|nr:ABC transporter permease [Chitinophagaceae bacterium]